MAAVPVCIPTHSAGAQLAHVIAQMCCFPFGDNGCPRGWEGVMRHLGILFLLKLIAHLPVHLVTFCLWFHFSQAPEPMSDKSRISSSLHSFSNCVLKACYVSAIILDRAQQRANETIFFILMVFIC